MESIRKFGFSYPSAFDRYFTLFIIHLFFFTCVFNQRVLIDDRIELSKAWTDKGGIFIHHIDTKSTLQKLVERGILRSPAVDSGYEDVHVQSNNDVS